MSKGSAKDAFSKRCIERILTDQSLKNPDKFREIVGLLRKRGYVVLRDHKNPYKFSVCSQCVVCSAHVTDMCSVDGGRCHDFVSTVDIVEVEE